MLRSAAPDLILADRTVHLQDLLSAVSYDRDGSSLISTGLYLDLPAWGRHVFAVSTGAIMGHQTTLGT